MQGGDGEAPRYQGGDSSYSKLFAKKDSAVTRDRTQLRRILDDRELYQSDNGPFECPGWKRVLGATRNAIFDVGYATTQAGLYSRSMTRSMTYFGWIVKGQEKSSALFWISTFWSYGFLFPSYVRGYWGLLEKFLGKEMFATKQREWQRLETKQQKAKFALSFYTALIKTLVGSFDTNELVENLSGHVGYGVDGGAVAASAIVGSAALTCNTSLLVGKQIIRTSADNPYLKFIVRDQFVDTPEIGDALLQLFFPTQESALSTTQKWFARTMTSLYSAQNGILYSGSMGAMIERIAQSKGYTGARMSYDSWLLYVMLVTIFAPMTVGNYAGNHPLIVNYTDYLFNGGEGLVGRQKAKAVLKRLFRVGDGGWAIAYNSVAQAGSLQKFLATSASFQKFGMKLSNESAAGKWTTLGLNVPFSLGTGYLALSLFCQPDKIERVPFIKSIDADAAGRVNAYLVNERAKLAGIRRRHDEDGHDEEDVEMQRRHDFN